MLPTQMLLNQVRSEKPIALLDSADPISVAEVESELNRQGIAWGEGDDVVFYLYVEAKNRGRAVRLLRRIARTREFELGLPPDFKRVPPALRYVTVAQENGTWLALERRLPKPVAKIMTEPDLVQFEQKWHRAVSVSFARRPYLGTAGNTIGYSVTLRGSSIGVNATEEKAYFFALNNGKNIYRRGVTSAPLSSGWPVQALLR